MIPPYRSKKSVSTNATVNIKNTLSLLRPKAIGTSLFYRNLYLFAIRKRMRLHLFKNRVTMKKDVKKSLMRIAMVHIFALDK